MSMNPSIVLASTSPRRRELMASLGVPFEVIAPTVDEEAWDLAHLSPAEQVLFLAREKAQSIAEIYPQKRVIGSDTLVAIHGQVLGKPKTTQDAFQMLNMLQGNPHQVFSAVAVGYQGQMESNVSTTQVWMNSLTESEISEYIETGEPMDKAGSYAIQGLGSLFIQRIEGCYFNVMGLPLSLLNDLLKTFGCDLLKISRQQRSLP